MYVYPGNSYTYAYFCIFVNGLNSSCKTSCSIENICIMYDFVLAQLQSINMQYCKVQNSYFMTLWTWISLKMTGSTGGYP